MNVSIDHPTDRPNFTCVTVGDLDLWFSYRTVVGFRSGWGTIVVSENLWGPTTGKHLGMIGSGDKRDRLPRDEFEAKLSEALNGLGVTV